MRVTTFHFPMNNIKNIESESWRKTKTKIEELGDLKNNEAKLKNRSLTFSTFL